jgi:hypothetical protein
MLRKALLSILALFFCALVVVLIDGVRRERAIDRLEKKSIGFEKWRYRLTGVEVSPFTLLHAPEGTWREFFVRVIATPRRAFLTDYIGKMPVDPSMGRDLAVLQIEELDLFSCSGLTPEVVSDLSKISSMRVLLLDDCDLPNEGVNRLWSQMPNLEYVCVEETGVTGDGFRDVKTARNLKRLSLAGIGITDEAIARVREAPALEQLDLFVATVTEDCAPLLASMPSLRKVTLRNVSAGAAIGEKLRSLNPRVAVETEP